MYVLMKENILCNFFFGVFVVVVLFEKKKKVLLGGVFSELPGL